MKRKPDEERKTQVITVRLSPEEYEQIERMATEAKIGLSEFIRDAALERAPTKRSRKARVTEPPLVDDFERRVRKLQRTMPRSNAEYLVREGRD